MLNNLTIVSGERGYGYDSYYLTRKVENLNFSSNSSIASFFGAVNYEIKDVSLNVQSTVKGTFKSVSSMPSGYLVGVSKHFEVIDEVVDGEVVPEPESNDVEYLYALKNVPIESTRSIYLRGTVYDGTNAIQTFTVDRGQTTFVFFDIEGLAVGAPKVTEGTIVLDSVQDPDKNGDIIFTWSSDPGENNIIIDYDYTSKRLNVSPYVQEVATTFVLSKVVPPRDIYDNISVSGLVSIKAKYVKIMNSFKCKIDTGYTYAKSRLFYTKCKYESNSCSSNSSAVVPAITVCNQRLF